MIDRRKFKRLEIPVPLVIRLLGTAKHRRPINTETKNVSREGLLIELQVIIKNGSLFIQQGEQTIKLIPFLVSNKKMVELDMRIPPGKERIRATGRVIWYDFRSREESYFFMAGIVLEEVGIEDRKRWQHFVRQYSSGRR